jgi:hypothetical protein
MVMSNADTTSGAPSSQGARSSPGASPVTEHDVVLDCPIKDLYYGSFGAVRDTAIPIKRNFKVKAIDSP